MVISRACALAPVRNFVVSASEKKRLKKLDVSKASGPDGLSAKVLRQCASVLAKPLTRLYSLFFKKGIPEGWKTANVVPVHKKTKKSNVENYRPISVLAIASKVLESIVNHQLCNFLVRHRILSQHQFGFRARLGTSDLLCDPSI